MVNAIGKTPQVVDDIAHQMIVRAFSAVESAYLCFQKIEKLSEIDMLSMPCGEWLSHGALLREWIKSAIPKQFRSWNRARGCFRLLSKFFAP